MMTTAPIGNMTVDEATAPSAERDGQIFYFCSEHCRQKFLGDGAPSTARPVQKRSAADFFCPMGEGVESDKPDSGPKCGMALESARPKTNAGKTIYTCPMHPEIEQEGLGACPKCGMDLEPKYLDAEGEDDSELRSMTLRFWVGVGLSVPVFLLAMLPMVGVPIDL